MSIESYIGRSSTFNSNSARKMNTLQLGLYSLVLPNVWAFAAQALAIGIYAGGMPPLLYGTLAWGLLLSLQCLSFAEFGSAFPSSIGCTLIASKLGGDRYGRFCGFATGGLHFLAGLVTPAALLSAVAPLAASIGTIAKPEYEPKTWHIFLIYQTLNIACSAFCIRSSKYLDYVATLGGICLFVIFFASLGILLHGIDGSTPKNAVWFDLENVSGWENGFAVFIGASLPLSGYGPIHWPLNMADQTKNPGKTIPYTLLIQQFGNILMLFAFFLAIGYGIGGNWDTFLESKISTPISAIFDLVIPTRGGTVALLVCILAFNAISLASYINATMRLMHGFAVTRAVPLSKWLSQYNHELNGPINITYFVSAITAVLGAFIFVTDAVLNTLIGGAMALYFVGYLPIFMAHIVTGGRNLGREGYFYLPKTLSIVVASANAMVVLLQVVAFCVPPEYPITIKNMNWAGLLTGICILSIVPSWLFYGKERYSIEFDQSCSSRTNIEGVDVAAGEVFEVCCSNGKELGKSS